MHFEVRFLTKVIFTQPRGGLRWPLDADERGWEKNLPEHWT